MNNVAGNFFVLFANVMFLLFNIKVVAGIIDHKKRKRCDHIWVPVFSRKKRYQQSGRKCCICGAVETDHIVG